MTSTDTEFGVHRLHRYPDRAELDAALAQWLSQRLERAIAGQARASVALSGGSTPKGLFARLSQQRLPWPQVDISLVDERWVPADDPQSNEGMMREQLLVGAAADANFVGMYQPLEDIEANARAHDARLAEIQQPFTVAVLGMGPDGHSASWFPDADETEMALDPGLERSTCVTRPRSQPTERLTLTYSCVARSEHLCLHITGDEKLAVLSAADAAQPLPIHRVLSMLGEQGKIVDIFWSP